jgi:hypothetical protein
LENGATHTDLVDVCTILEEYFCNLQADVPVFKHIIVRLCHPREAVDQRSLPNWIHKVDVGTVLGQELDAVKVASHARYLQGWVLVLLCGELKVNQMALEKQLKHLETAKESCGSQRRNLLIQIGLRVRLQPVEILLCHSHFLQRMNVVRVNEI